MYKQKKRITRLITAIFTLLIVFALAGCGGGNDSELVGRWRDNTHNLTFEFFRDGTGIIADTLGIEEEFEFMWNTENGQLTISYHGDDGHPGDYAISADGSTLTLFNDHGSNMVLTRLGSG
ncbi:MAG: DUF5640 domain-containing protein [Defluviitaleaceae bacterium]|nr:DUF5640 domain-containing protein [Defluviitaleaceae bacterium]